MNDDLSLQELEAQVQQILDAETNNFFELAKIAGINPLTDLKGADLRNSDLRKANLRGADLSYANLAGACLEQADLSRANLQGVNLSNANLSNANLSNANLSNAIVQAANFKDAEVYNLNLTGVDCSQASDLIMKEAQSKINKATLFYDNNITQKFQDLAELYYTAIDSLAEYIVETPQNHSPEFIHVDIYEGGKKQSTSSI